MKAAGIAEDEMTPEELEEFRSVIAASLSAIPSLADYISQHSRAILGQYSFAQLRWKAEIWGRRWRELFNLALQLAKTDPKEIWRLGRTEKHCKDCSKYANKVKRASYWRKIGARPQSWALSCHGIHCDCNLEVTDLPLSRGYLSPPTGGF